MGREAALRKALRLEGKELVGEDRAVTQLGWFIVTKKKNAVISSCKEELQTDTTMRWGRKRDGGGGGLATAQW